MDTSEQPAGHPPLTPADGETVTTNPPAMIWRLDERARSYVLELCQNPDFARQVIRVADLDMPFYNHSATLAEGKWHWRYFVMAKDGQQSEPSPVRSFVVSRHAVPLPVPSTKDILAAMPRHPRVFVTPDTLDAFRQRRLGPAKEAWDDLKWQADRHLASAPPQLKLQAFPEKPSDRRGLVFRLKDGQPFVPSGYVVGSLNADAAKANALSLAYVISGDPRYAEAARLWALFLADFRVDYHLKDRAQHDTVVYCYEYGLKYVALTFDRIHDVLSDADRRRILDHVDYHGEAAYQWCRDRLKLHLNYQNSHGQQCMHALLSTALAVAADSPKAAEWTDYLVRQYVNRIAWGGDDGGYSEGQKYGHKVQYILEALAALKTATGIDLFQKPRWRNTGEFWLYCMSLNYWWNHWGDCYSLVDSSFGSDADTYLTGFLATLTGNRCVKWYSDTRVTNPAHVPFWYLSASGLKPKPPVDIPQARLFPEAGQLAAYDRFYDHRGNRIFFRSSPWGGHSHAHADQNGFVLHVGGEIMACDAGYYTYAGDTYHKQWSVTTQAHNSILVNGQGQPKSIESKGRVSAFLNAPGGCFFLGDAARAYGSSLTRFDRAVLFIRPDVFIVYDELNAKEPADFTWVLNTFEAADIAPASRLMVVKQRRKRLAIRHLSPEALEYSQTNQRPFPIKDPKRAWSRFTEAFPQPWNIRVKTAAKREAERILAFMEAYDESAGPRTRNVERIVAPGALGVRFTTDAGVHTTIFRMAEEKGAVKADGLVCDARVVSVRRDGQGRVLGWLVHDGASLLVGGQPVFQSDRPCDLAADFSPPRRVFGAAFDLVSCAAQVCVQRAQPTDLRLWLPREPKAILAAPPSKPHEAKPLSFTWQNGLARVQMPEPGESALWVDPAVDFAKPLSPLDAQVADSAGAYTVQLETAYADNGDLIAFGELTPREPGVYELTTGLPAADILVQDRWDPALSVRATGKALARLREACEVFIRCAPTQRPTVRAALRESYKGKFVSLLRNGNFEEGIPNCPPRGWTISHPRTGDLGWPGWSPEGAAEGRCCMQFVRPKERITANSQPIRLRTGGPYVLRFKAKGTATHASVAVSGARAASAKVAVKPSADWQEYRADVDMHPGYCTISVSFAAGGEPNQTLWVDDMEFGRMCP